MKQTFRGDLGILRDRIWSLDLDPVLVKLTDKHAGHGWTVDRARLGAEEYRKFLFLTVARPETIVPTEFVDDVWHAHILDTMKYAEDCNQAFGFFLHHFPYFGIRSDADQEMLQSTFRATAEIYECEFGTSYFVGSDSCGNCSGCGTCGANACGSCGGSGYTVDDILRSDVRPSLASVT